MNSDHEGIAATPHLTMPDCDWEQAQTQERIVARLAEHDKVGVNATDAAARQLGGVPARDTTDSSNAIDKARACCDSRLRMVFSESLSGSYGPQVSADLPVPKKRDDQGEHAETSVAALCKELEITRQTLYRNVSPTGELREDGRKILTGR